MQKPYPFVNSKFTLGSMGVGSENHCETRSHNLLLAPRLDNAAETIMDLLNRQMLLPDIRAASGSEFYVFQHDSAPSHHATDRVGTSGSTDAVFYPTRPLAA